MKEIVEDIYNLIDKGITPSDDWCENIGKEVGNMLKQRLGERQDEYKLRMSSLGKGDRQLWYSVRPEIPKEELRPDTRLKFLFGDLIEILYIGLIRLAGHEVTHEQETVELNGIKGHIDCLVNGKLVDIKSAATFSFQKFQKEELQKDDPFGYYAQLSAYAEAMGVEAAGWFVMDKQMGKLCFSQAFPAYLPDMDRRSKEVIEMVQEEYEPEKCYQPVPDGQSGNMKLHTTCSYCAFKQHCWRDSNSGHGLRTFLYSTGPRFLTQVISLPKVAEVANGTY